MPTRKKRDLGPRITGGATELAATVSALAVDATAGGRADFAAMRTCAEHASELAADLVVSLSIQTTEGAAAAGGHTPADPQLVGDAIRTAVLADMRARVGGERS
ncbi:hypothetical protein [Nocardia sp. NPDC127526]|uniref:hypothetical protein n=1 Tax=Nocardia sp. NPDC127526 TaxID=3345393 RepID=UPI00362712C4